MNQLYKYLLYVSLLFLTVALYQANYLRIPQILSWESFGLAFVLLFTGFLNNVLVWKKILQHYNYPITWAAASAGIGLSIFTKYIPGSIWVIMGRAAYNAEQGQFPLANVSTVSLNAQLIAIWLGFLLGVFGLLGTGQFKLLGSGILLVWLLLTVTIFSRWMEDYIERVTWWVLKKRIRLPHLPFKSTMKVIPWFLLHWLSWSAGFYFLATSLSTVAIPPITALVFPLATTIGIINILTPGGIGTREGVIGAYLTFLGVPVVEATTIAIASRLWFLLGEVFIFIVGWIAHRKYMNPVTSSPL